MNDLSGQSLGRHHLIEKLGEEGMAEVYNAARQKKKIIAGTSHQICVYEIDKGSFRKGRMIKFIL